MDYQKFVCRRLNPNQQELNGEVNFDRNIDGRIFSSCILEIKDHTAILTDDKDEIIAVLSLHHFFLTNYIY
ncbi:hypothetical protein [Flavobacterium sp. UBA6046]|jgi:hypothetical protein|uniref:hypothetical protein n=1 Tax=Flavobacterium sp. UBA6046 TaxID=1946552 RepID=UPI0025C3BE5A|nr:hypothetical protein [Flavobacterium sp. UBA6046]